MLLHFCFFPVLLLIWCDRLDIFRILSHPAAFVAVLLHGRRASASGIHSVAERATQRTAAARRAAIMRTRALPQMSRYCSRVSTACTRAHVYIRNAVRIVRRARNRRMCARV